MEAWRCGGIVALRRSSPWSRHSGLYVFTPEHPMNPWSLSPGGARAYCHFPATPRDLALRAICSPSPRPPLH